MTSGQHFALATVVTSAEWRARSSDVLSAVRADLERQVRRRGLVLREEPCEDVEQLPCATRVRVTVSAEAVPPGSADAPVTPLP